MEPSIEDLSRRPGLVVIYDGQCPFCAAYVRMLRLREAVGSVELIDARDHAALVRELGARGYPLDDGMLVILAGRFYFGADAVALLSQLTTASGLVNRTTAFVLKRPHLANLFYPVMRRGRAVALSLLGRQPLQ